MTGILVRLIFYKLRQLRYKIPPAAEMPAKLLNLLDAEEAYVRGQKLSQVADIYEEAMLSYYFFLQEVLIERMRAHKLKTKTDFVRNTLS